MCRIDLEGRGYGLRDAEEYRVNLAVTFGIDHARYAWLNRALGPVDGTFDEQAGHARWNVYLPSGQLARNA